MDEVVSIVGGSGLIGGMVLALLVGEAGFALRRGRRVHGARDTLCSLTLGAGSGISSWLSASIVWVLVQAAWEHRVADLGDAWWAYGAAFIVVDFIYYWGHRLSHRWRWLWAAHRPHHSSRYFNLCTALRQSWTPTFLGAGLLGLPAVWLGLRPELVLSMYLLSHAYQFFLHTELVGSLGPLEYVLNTPCHHRVHHASNPRYLDRNFGGVLILWDRIFGTFAVESEDGLLSFGLAGCDETFDPFTIIAEEYVSMLRDVFSSSRALGEGSGDLGPHARIHDQPGVGCVTQPNMPSVGVIAVDGRFRAHDAVGFAVDHGQL